MNASEIIQAYHQRTKHKQSAYARGPEYLDWDSQPDPFRRYQGAPLIPFPFVDDPAVATTAFLTREAISKLLELSMGLSAWKEFGPDRWSLRCNPSSGNLHPTETYVVARSVEGLEDGIYHYAPHEHGLERRAGITVIDNEPYCLIGLSSIVWREAWKYGERAYRYVQLDVGHALGAMRFAAALLGWQISLISVGDDRIARLLGLDRSEDFEDAEQELPDLLIQIRRSEAESVPDLPEPEGWQGRANGLQGEPYINWPVLEEAHSAAYERYADYPAVKPVARITDNEVIELSRIIRQRRSAQSFIGKQSEITLESFVQFLKALLPDPQMPPWDLWNAEPGLHLVLFVHRVAGLTSGVYAMPRSQRAMPRLQNSLSQECEWLETSVTCAGLPLYQLADGDSRKVARALSCHQEIASAGSFSFAMLADFDSAMEKQASAYRSLHWEAGLLGQVAYLEAEKIGMRGTGIGCFFDDSVHKTLGIADTEWQSLYHFTVGFPRTDNRIQTLPPYEHLKRERI